MSDLENQSTPKSDLNNVSSSDDTNNKQNIKSVSLWKYISLTIGAVCVTNVATFRYYVQTINTKQATEVTNDPFISRQILQTNAADGNVLDEICWPWYQRKWNEQQQRQKAKEAMRKKDRDEACTSNPDCANDLDCVGNKCVYFNKQGQGDDCIIAYECANEGECINDKCWQEGHRMSS